MSKKWFVSKLFMRFFVPALLSSLGLAIGGIADCLYVGRMLNEEGLYIIAVTAPIYMIFTTWSIALSVGGAIHFSKVLGEGDVNQGKRIFFSTVIGDLLGIFVLSIIGIIFMESLINLLGVASDSMFYAEISKYVRFMLICCPILFMQAPLQYFVHAYDNPKLASLALVMGCVFDCLSGYIFIVVKDMGVIGSVWSTLVGALVMEAICVYYFFSIKFFGKKCSFLIFLKKRSLSFRGIISIFRKCLFKSFKTGFATATQYLYKLIILLVFNRMLFKISGENAVAVYDISVNAVSLVVAVIDAVVLAMIPMVSTFFGERNRQDVKNCLGVSMRVGLVSTGIIALVLMIFAPEFCEFMGLSPESVVDGTFAIRIVVMSSVLACTNSVLASFFQTIDLEVVSYVIMFGREFIVLLLCGILLAGGGFNMFWYAYVVTELLVLLGIIAILLYKKKVLKRTIVQFGEGAVFSETFVGSCENISETCERLQGFLEQEGASMKQAYFVALAMDEVCRLIAENTGDLMLQLTLVGAKDEYVLHIRDNAGKFNPFEISDEDERGLGLKIVKKQAKEYYYRHFVGFNTLTMSFAKEC